MSKFIEKYAAPDSVAIQLEDVTFHVILPTSANRKFERAAAACMVERDSKTGQFKTKEIDLELMFSMQHLAFLKSCVVGVDGLPGEFDATKFLDTYPGAAEDLYTKATELAEKEEADAVEDVGKSLASSNGQGAGTAKTNSMKVSVSPAA